ncbi:MAG: trypsin-like peptidase domain-containing protein [Clostridia bacterium]|nr:trypsin-like peptidase domain-containing protein [Clostridia bacterium]
MDDNFYQKFDVESRKSSNSASNILVPFISGVLGATLVVGTCFGVPSIRSKLLSSNEVVSNSSIVTQVSSIPTSVSLSNYSDTAVYAANKVLPSVVGISISYNVSVFGMTQTAEASGSGVIITNDGYILTNNHVVSSSDSSYYQVSKATKITVSLYGSEEKYEATIVGTDEQTDLAIIKIEADNLTPAELGDSSSLKVGEFVLAIGNPLGLDTSVTSGIISALGRNVTTSDGTAYHVLQTDCAINSGNSGGALVNSNGQVIGINTLKLAGTGIEGVGFAIPINDTIDVFEQLIKHGKVLRPYVGITGSNLSESTAKRYNLPVGIYVEDISENSGAYNSELRKGDVITAINGQSITTMQELNSIKNEKKIGDTITLTIYRSGEYMDVEITLTEMP